MAFSFGGGSAFGSTSGGVGSGQPQSGQALDEIQTEVLGFKSFNGEAKLRLLPSPWPSDALPPPTSSLLSISSSKGLLAAAGPESVVVASTESVRKGFEESSSDGDYRRFSPQLTIPIGTRISQVAFSSDGSCLVLSAEAGGGLAIYDTSSLMQGNTKSAFELSTNGSAVRALAPNPASPELFAVVTEKGELLIANMNSREFTSGQKGPLLREGVSCVSWSNKGKQLTAGLGVGSAVQLRPDGSEVTTISTPPGLQGDHHISALLWLENDIFLAAYTPNTPGDGMAPATEYYIITRQANAPFSFSKLPEICSPFGMNRSPAYQFFVRLRNFEPGLKDFIIASSTASQDIGLITKSDIPLTSDVPAEKIQGAYTTTSLANDARRAAMPMTEDMVSDTSPIGMALDLSSTTKVLTPITGDELESSPGPLPALVILTNEGTLCGWWVVYSNSVKQGLTYSSLIAAPKQQNQPNNQTTPSAFGNASSSTPNQTVFGQSSFGSSTSTPAFGSATKPVASAFGSSSTLGSTGAFGSAGSLGNKQSPWGSSSTSAQQTGGATFGQSAFGSASTLGGGNSVFGSAGGLGSKSSPWGTSSSTSQAQSSTTTGAVFGQSSFGAQKPSTFGSPAPPAAAASASASASPFAAAQPSSTSGFASFASSGGFASVTANAAQKVDGASIFGKPADAKPFASNFGKDSGFSGLSKNNEASGSGLFGAPKEGFSLTSSWKNPNTGAEDDKPAQSSFGTSTGVTKSLFGSEFGKTLGDASKETSEPVSNETEMTSDNEGLKPESPDEKPQETTTPSDTPAASKFFTAPPVSSGLFGTQTQTKDTPAAEVQKSKPTSFFSSQTQNKLTTTAEPQEASSNPFGFPKTDKSISEEGKKDTTTSLFGKPLATTPGPNTATSSQETPKKDNEKSSDVSKDILQAPLPPDTISKTSYTPGTSSSSSMAASKASIEEAPMPPDFLKSNNKTKQSSEPQDAPLPPDFLPTTNKPKMAEPAGDAPLPPDFLPSSKSSQPPTSQPSAESQALPDDKDDEGLDDEGSGVDVAQELSPTDEQSPKVTPESSFGQKYEKNSLGGPFAKINQPQGKQPSKPLFGELGASSASFFPPPVRIQQSPRSPSPVRRNVGDHLRPDNARSVSAPGVPLRDTTRKVTLGRHVAEPSVYPPQLSVERRQREEYERLARQRAQAEAEEEQELSDDEDDRLRAELESEIAATKVLEPFIAHQDYTGNVRKPGIPGQIEKVYRDINSMIDTLGLNSRSLEAWIKGQEELMPINGRDQEDLESSEDWCIDEIDNLIGLQSDLEAELAAGRVTDVEGKFRTCRELLKDIAKLRLKQADVRRTVDAKLDPRVLESLREAPLSPEQFSLRQDLRKNYTDFKSTLSLAEERLTDLRALLVSNSATNKSKFPQKVPTVEAVEKTILKMTSMVEKKSGDIDLLETQMRRLGVRASPASSREASPFVTPPTSAKMSKALARTPGSSVNGNGFYTPQSARSRFASSIGSNTSEFGRSTRKKMSEVSRDDASLYAEKAARKKQMHAILKDALVTGEVRIRTMDDL